VCGRQFRRYRCCPAFPGRFVFSPTSNSSSDISRMFCDHLAFNAHESLMCYKQHSTAVRVCRSHLLSLLGNDLPVLPLLAAAAPVELARAMASLRAMAHSQHSSILEACTREQQQQELETWSHIMKSAIIASLSNAPHSLSLLRTIQHFGPCSSTRKFEGCSTQIHGRSTGLTNNITAALATSISTTSPHSCSVFLLQCCTQTTAQQSTCTPRCVPGSHLQ
jgi:hypothetical protein